MEDAGLVVVVDAANVVGSRPDGWWRDRAAAARRLLGELGMLRERLPGVTDVVVVLEGAAKAAADGADGEGAGLRVVPAEGSGDDTIVEVVAAEIEKSTAGTGSVTVVTADRGLRARVEALGATTVGPSWLRNALE
ncbi:hypothetical protein ACWDUL_02680 [Nocardia niigatensis]|uniref:hypothetical protein n=1 Tax=Nocardia niigatensis TaxID=209249 RepID=UPI0002DD2374|nr:hypothetical protein [Nocardia niigatensis]